MPLMLIVIGLNSVMNLWQAEFVIGKMFRESVRE